jgi:hypothetical protein
MRTTLDIDDDVLTAARELAARERVSLGQAISSLARLSIAVAKPVKVRNGIQLLEPKKGATRVTMELVNRLRDEE